MSHTCDVLVVGAGFGGLCAGIKLLEAGITNFVILEKADGVGGTWRENTHPGAGCDVRTLVYSLDSHLRLGREAVSSVFDETSDTWALRTAGGERYHGRVVIAAPGQLHVPSIPDFDGRDDFGGVAFHSAEWDHDFNPAGKRIAVIGTGASATQFIPQLAKSAASLTVFQRTPHWVIPKLDRPISRAGHWLFRNVLRARPTPTCTLGCKRIVVASDYYPALQRPNVELVTSGIGRITESGIRTADGAQHQVDAIIYGTGFQISDQMADAEVVGRDGLTMQQARRDGMQPYLGVAAHGFPNYFLIMGPNSGGRNESIVSVIEAQVRYIVECLRLMEQTGSTRIEVRRSTQQLFNERIDAKLTGSVWNSGGCRGCYLDEGRKNRAAWPGSSVSYWRRMRRPVPSAFDLGSGAAVDDEVYDGSAALTVGNDRHAVRVRLTGHIDPIDGQYHWQGMLFDAPPTAMAKGSQPVLLTIDDRTVPARITEHTPWGSHSIAGVGRPPFRLDNLQPALPRPTACGGSAERYSTMIESSRRPP